MSLARAASAVGGLMFVVVVMMVWWWYDAGKERDRLNAEYLELADQVRDEEKVAKSARLRRDDAETLAMDADDELERIRPDGKKVDARSEARVTDGLRARADHLVSGLTWFGFALDRTSADRQDVADLLGGFDTYRVAISEMRRIGDSWIVLGEALTEDDTQRFAKRLKASPHLSKIALVESKTQTEPKFKLTYTRFKLSMDVVTRPVHAAAPTAGGAP